MTGANNIRVLIAEDSPTQRQFLSLLLQDAGGFEIVGLARDGLEAIAETERLRPDIVLMDCHMPKADGFEATRAIMEQCPTPIVMISSTSDEVGRAFDAVRCGALTFIKKPVFQTTGDVLGAEEFARTVRLMSEIRVVRRWRAKPITVGARIASPPQCVKRDVKVIAIAGSTGAPGVIGDILRASRDVQLPPTLIVQHMAEGFVGGFASWLTSYAGMPVHIAQDSVTPVCGQAYLAPDNYHLGIDANGRLVLDRGPPEEGFRPSANYLFRAVSRYGGKSAMGVLLTGMGKDGASGLRDLRNAGGLTVAQDEASCVVFGMPREAIAIGAVDHVASPSAIARMMLVHAVQRGKKGNG
jgi:two-component system chemotaxis response regulator CheB